MSLPQLVAVSVMIASRSRITSSVAPIRDPAGYRAEQDQARHPLRVPQRIFDRNRCPLRDAEERKFIHARFQIGDLGSEAKIVDGAVPQTIATFVIANEAVVTCAFAKLRGSRRGFPIPLDA